MILDQSFKPYYKWIVLNTLRQKLLTSILANVLNLIINGQSSILYGRQLDRMPSNRVLNLIINGQSSIHLKTQEVDYMVLKSFKPYYKWIVLNTYDELHILLQTDYVLNLIINGQSSILKIVLVFVKLPSIVLNLIINGQSSIHYNVDNVYQFLESKF